MATKKASPIKEITKLAQEFIDELGVKSEVKVSEQQDEEGTGYLVSVTGDDLGVLIGYHGETLNSLQLILSLLVSKKLDAWTRITLDAGDWRAKRFETLQEMAARAAEKAIATGQEQVLPVMSSSDRRLVHLALQENANVITESTGEEGYRRVVVKLRP